MDTRPLEEHRISGEKLLARVRELVHEGNVRRLIIRNEEGRTLIEVPLTVGVVGAVLLPVWAAVGAIAAVVNDCSILVERADSAIPEKGKGVQVGGIYGSGPDEVD